MIASVGKNSNVSWVPAIILGLFIQYQSDWVRLFSDKMWVELLLIGLATSVGFLFGFFVRRKKQWLLLSLCLYPIIWFTGQPLLLYFVDISYFSWNLVLITALIGGFMTYHLKPSGKFEILDFALIIIGFLLAEFTVNATYLYILFTVILLLGLTTTQWKFRLIPALLLILGFLLVEPPEILAKQTKYEDHLVAADKTRSSQLDITKWRNHYWYYVNGQSRISSLDDWLYHEPLVHPAMNISKHNRVLILGGETGGALKEVLKYQSLESVTIVPYDFELFEIFQTEKLPSLISNHGDSHNKVDAIKSSVFKFLTTSKEQYDVIICDLPDPTTLEYNQYYTKEFFDLCYNSLSEQGVIVTQAGSPYFATKAFYAIGESVKASGFSTVPFHNQVLTMGEWGWFVGVKEGTEQELKKELEQADFSNTSSVWINNDAMKMMMAFGKITSDTTGITTNTIQNPVIFQYYTKGNWAF